MSSPIRKPLMIDPRTEAMSAQVPGTDIVSYLMSLGFIPMRYSFKTKRLEPSKSSVDFFSTTDQPNGQIALTVHLVKEVAVGPHTVKLEVTYGLGEADKPPTLLHPLPSTSVDKKTAISSDGKSFAITFRTTQDETYELLRKYTAAEVFDAMFDRRIILQIP